MDNNNLREAYGRELLEIARRDERVVALDADLCGSTMTKFLQDEIPERFFEMGIAEANMVSVAAGLALSGKIPFVNSFSVFAAGQPYNQIRQGIALPNLNVRIVGSSCGLSDSGDGATHQSIDDIAIMRVIPNMTIVEPVDTEETRKVVRASLQHQGPMYIRINRSSLPLLTNSQTPFSIGKMNKITDGSDIVIFATGLMVSQSVKAREILEKDGLTIRIINVNTIKPLDKNQVIEYSKNVKGIITVEEHSVIGGLGSAVSELLCDSRIPMKIIGIEDKFGQSAGSHEELLEYYNLTPDAIVNKIKNLIS
jgi:transketolase